jgi:hypothetical protein
MSQRGRDSQAVNCSTARAAGRSKSSARNGVIHIIYQRLDTAEDAILSWRLLSVFLPFDPRGRGARVDGRGHDSCPGHDGRSGALPAAQECLETDDGEVAVSVFPRS